MTMAVAHDPPPAAAPPAAAPPAAAPLAAAPPAKAARPARTLVPRHGLAVRITHWINVVALFFLIASGLQIFNAHPALYWGQRSYFGHPWLVMGAYVESGRVHGATQLGDWVFRTTGFLGASKQHGAWAARGFPEWLTIPSWRDLALGRRWHFFFAWVFAINGAVYMASALVTGHLRRDLVPTAGQLKPRHVLHEVWDHVRLRFPKGEEARRYNVLQKGAYLGVVALLLPLMVLTGMTMSPSLDANFPFLLDVFGGRQSARSIHFICASLIVLFFAVHIVMVVLSGTWNNVRSMITGRYAIEVEPPRPTPIASPPSAGPPSASLEGAP